MPRVFIVDKATDLQSLATSLARNARTFEATVQRLTSLNPQIAEARKVAAGTVLLLPDAPELKPGLGEAAGTAPRALADVASRVRAGLRAMDARSRELSQQRSADHATLREALKAAPAKRLVESDPVLAQRLAAAEAAFKAEQKRAVDQEAQLAQMAKVVDGELARLQKLFG
jgi:hypothetical protein